ncbi:MAG: hypothetical protein F6J93_04030 [Oscillatoria sp. SIO1A7]|nr:hypothetical protein [Oscillatoria sp. SIO1A7]
MTANDKANPGQLSEEEIDNIAIEQAEDDSAWEDLTGDNIVKLLQTVKPKSSTGRVPPIQNPKSKID